MTWKSSVPGTDEDEKTWNAVIRQALIAGYLTKDIENYGLLKISPKGKDFMKKPVSFKITKDNEFEDEEEEVLYVVELPVQSILFCTR